MQRSQPACQSSTSYQPKTVVSFSALSGSSGPTLLSRPTRMRAQAGTLILAMAASCCGVLPTVLGLMSWPPPKRVRPSAAACSSLMKYAPWRSISALSCAAIGLSATTACSVAQMTEQSNDLELTMSQAALATSALRST